MTSTTTVMSPSLHWPFYTDSPALTPPTKSLPSRAPNEKIFDAAHLAHHQPRRRQNKSCDQCRAGKRRCDAQVEFRDGIFASTACSNCRKWKKHCTNDWARSHHDVSEPASKRRASLPKNSDAGRVRKKRNSEGNGDQRAAMNAGWHPVLTVSPFEPTYLSSVCHSWSGSPESGRRSSPHHPRDDMEMTMQPLFGPTPGFSHQVVRPQFPATESCCTLETEESHDPITHFAQEMSLSDTTIRTVDQSLQDEKEDRPGLLVIDGKSVASSLPFPTHILAEDHSKAWIRTGLLKIYHDSMEGALSCWLVERNCPYTLSSFDSKDAWSVNWSNRIAKRVCALDEAYSKTGAMSRADRKQASNVLNLVIMAFAAQWAQSGARGTARLPKNQQAFNHLDDDVFSRDMQERLWFEASQALSAANQNPSFKVIFASIIFSLTQRPLNPSEIQESDQRDNLDLLHTILEHDGSSIFLDIALRKLHNHQRELADVNGKLSQALSVNDNQTFRLVFWLAIMFDTLSAAMNRRSFVVNDHDSSLHQEPASENRNANLDCDLDGWNSSSVRIEQNLSAGSTIWGAYFLEELSQDGYQRKKATRWPCSYEDGASCLADAAPVKVLLFRRVAHLQDLFYQRASPATIEAAINSVLEVYDHWNASYGLFIADCITHHESLPARIQSWYILLSGHWNLAVFLFGELLDKIDAASMGLEPCVSGRQVAATSETMRAHSVQVVSDLGRTSRYTEEDLSFSRSPDFHHAVNKAALLTEPWTVVLVRVFGKAAEILVKQIRVQQDLELIMDVEDNLKDTRSRLQYCLEALWLLGKKSDTAMFAANLLQKAVT